MVNPEQETRYADSFPWAVVPGWGGERRGGGENHGGPTSHLCTPEAQGSLLGKLASPVTQAESQCRRLQDISGAPLIDGI